MRPTSTSRMTRRQLTALLGATPLAAQVVSPSTTQKTPPFGVPVPSPEITNPDAKLRKANEGIHKVSARLAQLEVPMDVEPAFVFKT